MDFGKVARMASGASGAELANIINEAALRAVRDGRSRVSQADLEESIEVVIAGYQKKNAILTDREKKIVAYHEVGHALVAALQNHPAPVQKITIVPRTSGALGYTMQVEEGNHYLLSKEELENKIATLTGGRAAEELVFHSVSTGASNDIEQATKLARSMMTRYGMSPDFDMVALETVTNQYLGGDASLACSAQTQTEIDRQVVALGKPLIFTEYGADTVLGLWDTLPTPYTEEYQVEYYRMNNRVFDQYDFVVGEQAWNFADFAPSPSLLRVQGNRKGLFTRDRRPKLAAHYFRQRWHQIPDFNYQNPLP